MIRLPRLPSSGNSQSGDDRPTMPPHYVHGVEDADALGGMALRRVRTPARVEGLPETRGRRTRRRKYRDDRCDRSGQQESLPVAKPRATSATRNTRGPAHTGKRLQGDDPQPPAATPRGPEASRDAIASPAQQARCPRRCRQGPTPASVERVVCRSRKQDEHAKPDDFERERRNPRDRKDREHDYDTRGMTALASAAGALLLERGTGNISRVATAMAPTSALTPRRQRKERVKQCAESGRTPRAAPPDGARTYCSRTARQFSSRSDRSVRGMT